jgi:hypothetical protein
VLLVLLLVSFGQALVSRARLVTPFGCGMSGFKELQKAVESTQLNSYSNVEVVSDHDAEGRQDFLFFWRQQTGSFCFVLLGRRRF